MRLDGTVGGDGGTAPEGESFPQARHARVRRRQRWPLVAAAAIVLAGIAAGGISLGLGSGSRQAPVLAAAHSAAVAPRATITVTGSGTVEGTPDTVSFQIGVHTSSPTATAALEANNSQVRALESTLARDGVQKRDMQTSNLNISENRNRYNVLTGFSVDDDLNVTTHDISRAGAAIDAAARAVGNGVQLYGVTFSISDQSGLLATARAKAMQNARTEADQIAQGAGLALGGVVRVTDNENGSSPIPFLAYGAAGIASRSVPIEAGSQPVNVQVTVVYLLRS